MIVGKERCADKHKQRPNGNGHQYSDIGCLLGFLVTLGSQITLYDGLVGAILLQGVEDTVEYHNQEAQFRKAPVVRTKTNLVVLRCYTERLGWATLNAEQQDGNTDDAATDEQETLGYIHPYDGFHATK